MVPAAYKKLTSDLLRGLLDGDEPALQLEAVRALAELPTPRRLPVLRQAARDGRLNDTVRAQAIVGLASQAHDMLEELLALAQGSNGVLRAEALRALTQTRLDAAQRAALETVARSQPNAAPLVARVLGRPFATDRPPPADIDAWLRRLEGRADAEVGRRVFFHPRLGGCSRCHRAEGRGQEVGPDLGTAGRNGRRHLVESILQPSALVAPHYQTWQIETTDGKVRAGLLVRTVLDEYTYLGADGEMFRVNTRDVVESRPVPQSLMPDGLADLLTDQELRDLLAYLESQR
jgi:putative heme-binding domain-containing protein